MCAARPFGEKYIISRKENLLSDGAHGSAYRTASAPPTSFDQVSLDPWTSAADFIGAWVLLPSAPWLPVPANTPSPVANLKIPICDGEFHSALLSIQGSLDTLSVVDCSNQLDVLEGWTPLATPCEAPVIDPLGLDLNAIAALDCDIESGFFSITRAFMSLSAAVQADEGGESHQHVSSQSK